MPEGPETSKAAGLVPLPYHDAIRAYLKQQEADIWQWYSSHQVPPGTGRGGAIRVAQVHVSDGAGDAAASVRGS